MVPNFKSVEKCGKVRAIGKLMLDLASIAEEDELPGEV